MLLLFTVWGISLASKLTWTAAGADPEIEKGGGHTYRVGVGAACVERSCLCAYSAQSVVGGSAGMLPQEI